VVRWREKLNCAVPIKIADSRDGQAADGNHILDDHPCKRRVYVPNAKATPFAATGRSKAITGWWT
jgi:hypothetical protein